MQIPRSMWKSSENLLVPSDADAQGPVLRQHTASLAARMVGSVDQRRTCGSQPCIVLPASLAILGSALPLQGHHNLLVPGNTPRSAGLADSDQPIAVWSSFYIELGERRSMHDSQRSALEIPGCKHCLLYIQIVIIQLHNRPMQCHYITSPVPPRANTI